jgi:hypothetical protein
MEGARTALARGDYERDGLDTAGSTMTDGNLAPGTAPPPSGGSSCCASC